MSASPSRPAIAIRRRGFTLIELVLTLTFSTGIMVAAVSLVVRVRQLHGIVANEQQFDYLLTQLGEQFRMDVARSVSVELIDDHAIRLTNSEREIIYRFDEGLLHREQDGERLPSQLAIRNDYAIQFEQEADRIFVMTLLFEPTQNRAGAGQSGVRTTTIRRRFAATLGAVDTSRLNAEGSGR